MSGHGLRANGSPRRQCQTVGVHLTICVSYVDYIEDTSGDNASTTQRKAHARYIEDTQFRTVDKCRTVASGPVLGHALRVDLESPHVARKNGRPAFAAIRRGGLLRRLAPLCVQSIKLCFQGACTTSFPIPRYGPSIGRRRATHQMLRQCSSRYRHWRCEDQTASPDVGPRVFLAGCDGSDTWWVQHGAQAPRSHEAQGVVGACTPVQETAPPHKLRHFLRPTASFLGRDHRNQMRQRRGWRSPPSVVSHK